MTATRSARWLVALLALIGLAGTGCGSSTNDSTSAPATSAPAIGRSTPVSLTIPAIGLSGSLIATGLTQDGKVQVPADYHQASWYQPGPAPGEQGSAVLLGHVDNVAGPGVFFDLKKLKHGDTVDVARADGKTAHFTVDEVQTFPKKDFPNQQVFGGRDRSTLQLVTCGGDFDSAARSYLSNVVVFTSLASTS